ncbi:MAG: hypothetical protein N2C13_05225 [Chloroflexota bacterium]
MSTNNERMKILELIDSGEINAQEGAKRLDDLNNPTSSDSGRNNEDTRMSILEKIENGQLSPEEGAERLKNARPEQVEQVIIHSDSQSKTHVPPEDLERWKQLWLIPLWVGIGVTVLSGLWMNSAYAASGTGFWFFCSLVPLMMGAMLILLGSLSSSSRWMHIRVKEAGHSKANVAISLPIPTRFAAWLLRTFGRWVPGLNETIIDEVIVALDKETIDSPFYVHVDDDEDGEQVDIFIG